MKVIIVLYLMFWSWSGVAQVDTVSEQSPYFPGENYSFPILIGGDKLITDKINQHITSDFLNKPYQGNKLGLFENIWGSEEDPYYGLSELSFDVFNKEKIYTVDVRALWCRAYCDDVHSVYNYDIETGEFIGLDTLIDNKFRKMSLNYLSFLKRQYINNSIDVLLNGLGSDTVKRSRKRHCESAISVYNECLEWSTFDRFESFDYRIYDQFIILESKRCGGHIDVPLIGRDNFYYKFKISRIQQYLSTYGKKLLLN